MVFLLVSTVVTIESAMLLFSVFPVISFIEMMMMMVSFLSFVPVMGVMIRMVFIASALFEMVFVPVVMVAAGGD